MAQCKTLNTTELLWYYYFQWYFHLTRGPQYFLSTTEFNRQYFIVSNCHLVVPSNIAGTHFITRHFSVSHFFPTFFLKNVAQGLTAAFYLAFNSEKQQLFTFHINSERDQESLFYLFFCSLYHRQFKLPRIDQHSLKYHKSYLNSG